MFDSAKKIKNIILISILTLTSLVICFQNFSSNTYLSGWDTLQSEFDFGIAFRRAISPAFQDHQGIGAVSSQSHLGDLPRITFLYLLSFIFSQNFLRYSYVFLMLIIGPLGVYYFLKDFLGKSNAETEDDSTLLPSFIGAFFYLTNLSVVQHFNIPLEMFLTLYGYLGFIFLYSYRILKEPKISNLRNLIIVSFLISPSSHTATLFYMFIVVLFVYLFVNYLFSEDRKTTLKNSLVVLGTIIGVNLFWIFPNLYFIFTHGKEVSNSKIHSLFSDQAYLSNLAFGNIYDIAILKNYLFLWQIWNGQKFVSLLQNWIENLTSGISFFGYLTFFFAIFGIGASWVKKEKKLYGFFAIFFLSFIFIASSNSILGGVIDFVRENVPFMKEALRFPFNKFSTLFSFTLSVFLGYFALFLFTLTKQEILKIFTALFFAVFSIVFFLPAFKGDLINPLMRINFDKNYFEVFKYFTSQEEFGRVADLPIHSVYGWSYYNFGYQGAGFLWFGIDKPLFNREFDRWNVKNEDYYNEMSFAVYNDDSVGIEKVLNKYQIRWILFDKNIISPNDKPELLHFEGLDKTLGNIKNLKLDKKIGENIYIYKYSPQSDFMKSQIIDNVSYLSNESYRENSDKVYKTLGNYYSDFSNQISYGLKTPIETINKNLLSSDNDNFYLKNIKNLSNNETLFNVSFKNQNLLISALDNYQTFTLPKNTAYVKIADQILKDGQNYQVKIGPNTQFEFLNKTNQFQITDLDKYISIGDCGINAYGAKYSLERNGTNYKLSSENITSCLNLDLSELSKNKDFNQYILSFNSENYNSNSYFCVINKTTNECNKIKLEESNDFAFNKDATNLVFYNEPTTNSPAATIFSNLTVNLVNNLGNQSINLNPNFYAKSDTITVKKDSNFSGDLSKFGSNPRVCQTQDLSNQKLGTYNSKEYNICDNLTLNYDGKSYYILEIISKNNSGLPLRLCLQNSKSLRCDSFMALPKNKEFTPDFILIPPYKEPHNLAITNQVIEGNTSSNEISYLSVRKIDYEGLFNLKSENQEKLFVYNKAYENGFIAWCGNWICPYKHVLFNNWANGWVLPNDSAINSNDILVIFWPNYLALIGILAFFLINSLSQGYIKKLNKPIVIDKIK